MCLVLGVVRVVFARRVQMCVVCIVYVRVCRLVRA